jgi:hypothetical protein
MKIKKGEASLDFDLDGNKINESGDNTDLCIGASGFLFRYIWFLEDILVI